MSLLTSNFRKPTLSQGVLFGLILFCCTVDASRQISVFGVSGLGAGTLAAGGAVWAVWLIRPLLPKGLLTVLLPLMLFQIDALGTLFWYKPGMDGVQLATVGLTFIGVLMLTAREACDDPALAPLLHRTILLSSVLPVSFCALVILTGRLRGEDLNLTRPFALYTLCVVAVSLATWLAHNRPADRASNRYAARTDSGRRKVDLKTFVPLGWALVVAYVVFLGLSRTALVGILMMMPLSVALRGNRKSLILSVVVLAIGASSFFGILSLNQDLHKRFFGEDAHMKVGGVSINGTGRTAIWNLLLEDIHDDWAFGRGISSSEDTVTRVYPQAGQPHNDYIRFYYDQGIVGLSIWLIFVAGIVYRIFGNLRASVRNKSGDYPMHLAALLGLASVSFSMLTDNSVCYTPVMVPLAILLGSSLGTGAASGRRTAYESLPAFPVIMQGNPWPAR